MGRRCVGISTPSNKGEFQCKLKNVLCVLDYSSNLLSVWRCTEWGHSFTFVKGNIAARNSRRELGKTNARKLFVLPILQRSRIQDEFQEWILTAQGSGTDDWVIWIKQMRPGMHQKQLRDSMMYAMRIGQDHEDSSKKSGRDPSRREAGESVRRRDGTFQSRVTVKIQLLHCVCRPVLKGCVCWLA